MNDYRAMVPLLLSCVGPLAFAAACEPKPGACQPADASTRVDLVVDMGDYPVPYETPRTDSEGLGADGYRMDQLQCVVTLVDLSDSSRVRMELDCYGPRATHSIAIEHAATDQGDPVWDVGDSLSFAIDLRVYSDLNDVQLLAVALRSLDGEPRLVAIDSDDLSESIAAPLELSLDPDACPDESSGEQTRGMLALTLDGASTRVVDGNDGTLETPNGTYAVELAHAVSGDFGERSLDVQLLVMKVQ